MIRATRDVVLGALSVAALAGCGAAPHSRGAGAVTAFGVRPVEWNPAHAQVGPVRAVADVGNVVAVFGSAGATVISSGAVVVQDPSVTSWVAADTIAGANGSARWIVGIDGNGHLYYLRGLSSFDDVSARYGLDGRPVRGAAMFGSSRVGFLLGQEIAVADGHRVTRFGAGPFQELVGGSGWGAGVGADQLVVFDADKLESRAFPLHGVAHAAVGSDGRVYAATSRALYAMSPQGVLELVYDAEGETLHGLVASGDHVWFADGAELGVVDGDHVAETTGAKLTGDSALAPSPSGDVWVIAKGSLARFARTDPEPALANAWQGTLAPVFARSCSSCHLPSGPSGTDLSSAEAWQTERSAIRERVVVTKTMPPEGHVLSDADRAAIAGWVGSP